MPTPYCPGATVNRINLTAGGMRQVLGREGLRNQRAPFVLCLLRWGHSCFPTPKPTELPCGARLGAGLGLKEAQGGPCMQLPRSSHPLTLWALWNIAEAVVDRQAYARAYFHDYSAGLEGAAH